MYYQSPSCGILLTYRVWSAMHCNARKHVCCQCKSVNSFLSLCVCVYVCEREKSINSWKVSYAIPKNCFQIHSAANINLASNQRIFFQAPKFQISHYSLHRCTDASYYTIPGTNVQTCHLSMWKLPSFQFTFVFIQSRIRKKINVNNCQIQRLPDGHTTRFISLCLCLKQSPPVLFWIFP